MNKNQQLEKLMMFTLLKTSGLDVPSPQPIIEKHEKKLLNEKGLDQWYNLQIMLNSISEEDRILILQLALAKYLPPSKLAEITTDKNFRALMEDTLNFVKDNPEYQSKQDIDSILPELSDIFG